MFISGKLLDLEKNVATTKPMIKSFPAENEMLKNKFTILTIEAKNETLREIFFICRLWGNPCSSLGSFWIWRRMWPQLSL